MATSLNVNVDIEGEREFNRVLTEYRKWATRQPREIAAAKGFFIALRAAKETKVADKEQIRTNLSAGSQKFPKVPLAAVLINRDLGKKGKKGLSGEQMAKAVEKKIKRSQSRTGFVASPWLTAAKKMDYYNQQGDVKFSKRYAPKKPTGRKPIGKAKGDAVISPIGKANATCTISNFAGQGKQNSKTIRPIIMDGLNRGVKVETASMISYITRKHQEQFEKMQRTGRV